MRRGVLAVLGLAVGVVPATTVSLSTSAQTDDLAVPEEAARGISDGKVVKTYIVTMADEPAATYEGGTAGIPATAPDTGEKLATKSEAVTQYRDFLNTRHNAALRGASVGQSKKIYDYTVTVNGFAADLSGAEAARLQRQPGVLSVAPDTIYQVDTITTPDFLGLTAPGGAWSREFKGGNTVIGVVDSGIWPENPSFSDTIDGKLKYGRFERWNGTCVTGEQFNSTECNNKLIGARFYAAGWGGQAGIEKQFPYEYYSPRDADGHGSHTASTAAGNRGMPVVIDGTNYGNASGMAPRARIAAYKVCWGRGGEGGCFGSDSVAAIDQAVADGVDAINFSISGTSTNFLDPVELAFLRATNAGVFVAASAGNSGPGAATVAHPSPWITTVAASTHDRKAQATLTTGDGKTYTGASAQKSGTPKLDLVYAADVKAASASAADAALCDEGTLDRAKVAGKMVLCDRGVIARTAKSMTVRDAGGKAMVLGNPTPNSINADFHFVPTIHVDVEARNAILAYIQASGPSTGQLAPGQTVKDETAPLTAAFSSRGPLQATGDLLKPDITAPGVDVLAAVSPDGYFGRDYDLLSGTSMSSPHMAGLSLVLKSAHRTWTPAMLKSAMMTTAYDVDDANAFDVGSGHVDINRAIGPALVYDAGVGDYFSFLCGTEDITEPALCANPIDPSNLNQPNIAIGELAGKQTVTRTVTNAGGGTARFSVSVQEPAGVDVIVKPSSFTLPKRATQTYTVTFTTNDDAAFDEYAFGELTWTREGGRTVNSDIVVKPVELAAPDEVSGEGVAGSGKFDITFGYTGPYNARAHGFEPATQQDGNVKDDPTNDINTALRTGVGVTFHRVVVPAGTLHTRVSLFDEYTDGNDDLDLYLFDGAGRFVGGSGSGTSAEQVDVANPTAGTYTAVVHGWQTDGPDANYTLFDWSVPADPADPPNTLKIVSAPTAAVVGETETIEYKWKGLAVGNKYLGAVSHNRGAERIDATLVSVDNDTP
ncbi:MAG: S8 family serine peptidase [Acidimicrobiia bacterium]|nr:S8 family serine peptidase [Acidimicrobiia bacterium]